MRHAQQENCRMQANPWPWQHCSTHDPTSVSLLLLLLLAFRGSDALSCRCIQSAIRKLQKCAQAPRSDNACCCVVEKVTRDMRLTSSASARVDLSEVKDPDSQVARWMRRRGHTLLISACLVRASALLSLLLFATCKPQRPQRNRVWLQSRVCGLLLLNPNSQTL